MLLTMSWSWRRCVISFRGRLCTSQFMTSLLIPGQRRSLGLFTSCYCGCFDGWIAVGRIMNHVLHTSYRKDEFVTVYPADVVLFEGILMFYSQEVRDLFQMKLFVDTDPDTRLSRRGRWPDWHFTCSLVLVVFFVFLFLSRGDLWALVIYNEGFSLGCQGQ